MCDALANVCYGPIADISLGSHTECKVTLGAMSVHR
jgi:hypothetical protein